MSRMLLNVSPNTEPTSAALRPLPALPCLVRVAVHSGADGRRRAGGVEEDGGDGSAEHAGLIDAEQHGDAHQRADDEGQRQEDGNGHDSRNAGDGPEHEPREDAEGHGPDGFRSEDGNEPCTDVREHVARCCR